jgi:murein L,D-transpeptidase YafK
LPEELLFNVKEEKLEHIADYVDTMQSNLKSAFLLARKQQYAAAIGNRERLPERSKPNFRVGDKLYVWEVSSKDTTVMNSEATISPNSRKSGPTPGLAPSILLNGYLREVA